MKRLASLKIYKNAEYVPQISITFFLNNYSTKHGNLSSYYVRQLKIELYQSIKFQINFFSNIICFYKIQNKFQNNLTVTTFKK